MQLIIINGPNLNLLGKRQPEVYGSISFSEYFTDLKLKFPNIKLEEFQSNSEGIIIDKLHTVGFTYNGIILNAGAFTHYSYAIADAIAAIKTPVVEVHISNIFSREDFRKQSVISSCCFGHVSGFGLKSYQLAIESFLT
ncbi:MAG: type II 3-dehydroquinate dehydratase [Bacteroidia bacterium]|nr:type II 3-dehydroquinate dehydratase [Bacteroidia bacterium]